MSWDITRAAFRDELKKIAEINMSGVSPQRVGTMFEGAPPMETDGYSKAKQVLSRLQSSQEKVANAVHRLPQLRRLMGIGRQDDGPPPDNIDKAKRFGGHVLAGGGAGRFIAEFSPKLLEPGAATKRKFVGTAIGAGLGAAEFARKSYKHHQWEKGKQKTAASPAMALKSAQQVGTKMSTRPAGITSVKNIVPKIGKVGVPNLV